MTESSGLWRQRPTCRLCESRRLIPVADFGSTPLSDRLRPLPDSEDPAPRVPLLVVHCSDCGLSQLSVDVSPDILYADDYPYYSSVSPALSAHFEKSARDIMSNRRVGPGTLVVEAASNDGCLLRHFAAAGARTVGFDPAAGPASVARRYGIDVRDDFFTREVAASLAHSVGRCEIFLANNVLAHVPDLRGFVAGIAGVLAPGGVAIIEVPYLGDLVSRREFDTIYHQHLCYFHVGALSRLFADAGMKLARVGRLDIHGGSLRLFVEHGSGDAAEVKEMIEAERAGGIGEAAYIARIGEAARHVREGLLALLDDFRRSGRKVRAYAAAGKATTMLSWCGLDADRLGSVADLNPHKHEFYMPGTDLRIVSPAELTADRPDLVVILAWNFADEIMAQLDHLRQAGTRFLIPVPEPRIL